MVSLIPFFSSDVALAQVYLPITIIAFVIRREKHDFLAYAFGLVVMTAAEYFFIQTGVETFTQHSLFGVMPVWLPLLWAYAFVVIKRSLAILG